MKMSDIWRIMNIEPFGIVKIYMKRDERMGQCVFEDGTTTPNMPKLQYAIQFEIEGTTLKYLDRLNPEIAKFDNGFAFEKRDGFNLLFYEWRGQIIPKTRMRPIASKKILKLIQLPEFPLKQIKSLVRDGYIPYFEVWGTKLSKFDITHGCVDVATVQEIEGLPSLNVDVIAIMNAETRKFLPPEKWVKLALSYELYPVWLRGRYKITLENIYSLMDIMEEQNRQAGTIITEGLVLHCYDGQDYKMFKVKPHSIMHRDVVTNFIFPEDRVQQEITKILIDVDILEIARELDNYYELLLDYLSEDYRLLKNHKRKIRGLFLQRIASAVRKEFPNKTYRELAELRIHKALFRFIKELDGL